MDDGGTTSAIWNEKLGDLGAAVTKTFTKSVTHVVWKKGKEATANKVLAAKSRGQAVKVVTVLWVDACVQTSMLADTCSYDVDLTNKEVFAKKVRPRHLVDALKLLQILLVSLLVSSLPPPFDTSPWRGAFHRSFAGPALDEASVG